MGKNENSGNHSAAAAEPSAAVAESSAARTDHTSAEIESSAAATQPSAADNRLSEASGKLMKENSPVKKKSYVSMLGVAAITITTLWGFNNNIIGYYSFEGTRVIIPWIGLFLLFLLPYAMMVGELGSTFKGKQGGVSSWIFETVGPKMAFFAGWIGWSVTLPYLAQKPSLILVAVNWLIAQNGDISHISPAVVQFIGVGIFLLCLLVASRGAKIVSIVASVAGIALVVAFALFVLLGLSAPFIAPNTESIQPINWDIKSFMPTDITAFLALSVLIFGLGGSEKVAPYIPRMKHPEKDFAKSMLVVVVTVVIVAIGACLALSMMFGQFKELAGDDFLTNGQYLCFQKLGEFYGVGNFFLILYSLVKVFGDTAVLIISIDVPLRVFAGTADARFIPQNLLKQNKRGIYPKLLLLESVIAIILLVIPAFGISNTDLLIKWLLDLCSICMPIFYLCVFLAYIALKISKKGRAIEQKGFIFIKNRKLGAAVGIWVSLIVIVAIVLQILNSKDAFMMTMNALTPLLLIALGLLFPILAKRYNKKHGITDEEAAANANKDVI